MNLRFSLFGLISLVTFAALACGALSNPGEGWLTVVVSLTAGAFIVQVLRAIQSSGQSRAAATGWLLSVSVYVAMFAGPWLGANVGPHLLSTKGLVMAAPASDATWQPVISNQPAYWDNFLFSTTGSNGQSTLSDFEVAVGSLLSASPLSAADHFTRSGHWLFAWLAGWLGASLTAHLWRRQNACVTVAEHSTAAGLASSRPA